MTAMTMAGLSSGNCTRQKICQGVAPMTRAALTSCLGSAEKPDRKIRKVSEVHCQMSAMMIAHCAAIGCDSQRMRGSMPKRLEHRRQELVERPAVDVDHREIVADDDRHDHHRHQEDRGVELLRARALAHQHGEDEADHQLERDRNAAEIERAPEREPEQVAGRARPRSSRSPRRTPSRTAGWRATSAG